MTSSATSLKMGTESSHKAGRPDIPRLAAHMADLVAQGPVILTLKTMDLGLEHFALEQGTLRCEVPKLKRARRTALQALAAKAHLPCRRSFQPSESKSSDLGSQPNLQMS